MFRAHALRPSWPYVGEVARSLLGIIVAVAVALEFGSAAAAIAAGGSAAIAGATALQDSAHGRLPLVVGVSFGMGAAVLIGFLTSPHPVLFIPTVALWSVAAGMVWAISGNAGLVAAAATALLVTAPAVPTTVREALVAAALAVGGGLTQAVLVAAWPRQRWRQQRRALSDAYRWVASSARKLVVDTDSALDPTPLIDLRSAFALNPRQAKRRPPAYRGEYGLPERIAMTLNALRSQAQSPAVRDVVLAAADVLHAIAETEHSHTARADAELALRRLDDSAAALSGSVGTVAVRLRDQVAEASALHFTGVGVTDNQVSSAAQNPVPPMRRPGVLSTWHAFWSQVAAQWDRNSPILRHAVRLSTGVVAGTLIARVAGLEHGYWIALTVLLVLRPETAHTYTRCISRIAGTAAGVLAATTLTAALHPSGLGSVVLAVVFVGVAYAVSGLGYVALSAAIAVAIVFLIDIDGMADTGGITQRLLATAVGGALAVASHVGLPDRSLVRLRQRAGELLKAEIDYAATVIRAFVHHLDDADGTLSAVWERATRARSAFEATSGSVRADSPPVRKWLMAYRAALNAVTGSCATLETHVPAISSATLDPRFIVAVDDYVDALRGELPSAGQPWSVDARHLAEADHQLHDAAGLLGKQDTAQRVLVAEAETITRHLLTVAKLST